LKIWRDARKAANAWVDGVAAAIGGTKAMTIELTKRPLAEPNHIDGNTNEAVYVVHGTFGAKEFRVPAGTPVVVQDQRWAFRDSSDPRRTLPNLEVRDGAVVVPLCDLVGEIVSRSEPVDLAKELWANDEVREEFIYCMAERYSEGGVGDADRRKLLDKVKEAIHSKALDKLADAMSGIEYRARDYFRIEERRGDFSHAYAVILELVAGASNVEEALARVVSRFGESYPSHDPLYREFEIGGFHWNEARDFWRAAVEKLFLIPGADKPE
jgi:hypothetical protein